MIRIMALNPSSLLYTRFSTVSMIRIFDIDPYAIAAPDALLRCGASANTARSTITDTHLDKLL